MIITIYLSIATIKEINGKTKSGKYILDTIYTIINIDFIYIYNNTDFISCIQNREFLLKNW